MSPDHLPFPERKKEPELLPAEHPLRRNAPINQPIYARFYQWRLKIQPFSRGGFEAKATLVDRNALNALINANQTRGPRPKPKEREEDKVMADRIKAAQRAARKVRQLCIEIRADRLLTLTSRGLLTDLHKAATTWKRFMRLLDRAQAKFLYVAVPEFHAKGDHIHLHVALSGFARVELLRRCWQIALGGKGDERGPDALGNVDIKYRHGRNANPAKRSVGIARYLSKYITKDFERHYQFNRRRYWSPKGVKLPEQRGEWLEAEKIEDALQELYERFDPGIMSRVFSDSLFISQEQWPMIFFRWIPDGSDLDIPF